MNELPPAHDCSFDEMGASVPDLLRLLQELYPCRKIFLRELITNAYDAILRRVREEGMLVSSGKITVRADGRGYVAVADNGIGMNETDLRDFLACLGKSATRACTKEVNSYIGRFGIGFTSVFAVARAITVDTLHCLGTPPAGWTWHWDGSVGDTRYSISKCIDRLSAGTTVHVQLLDAFTGLSDLRFLTELVRTHVPFLDMPIEIEGVGEPRPFSVPWQKVVHCGNGRHLSEGIIKENAVKEMVCINGNAAVFKIDSDGGGIVGFPESRGIDGKGISLYQNGVLIREKALQVIPENWEWIEGMLDTRGLSLTLDRGNLREDKELERVKRQIAGKCGELFVSLARSDYTAFQKVVKANRHEIARLLCGEPDLLISVCNLYPFETTLGERTFGKIAASVKHENGKRIFWYITRNPSYEARWAVARGEGRYVIWCQTPHEEQLLRCIIESLHDAELRVIDYGQHDPLASPEVAVTDEMKAWLSRMQRFLEDDGIVVEPRRFFQSEVVSVLELYDQSPSGLRDWEAENSTVKRALSHFFNAIDVSRERQRLAGTLMLNVANPIVEELSNNKRSLCPDKLAAALLLANGVVRTGVPVPVDWQNSLEKFVKEGIETLIPGPITMVESPHTVCFFAHQVSSDKPQLLALRKLLEYEPFFWEVKSADEETSDPQLFDNVMKLILGCNVFIADVSNANANVQLELGLAYGLKNRHNVLLLRNKEASAIADLKGQLVFQYEHRWLQGSGATFRHELSSWIAGQPNLLTTRGEYPFLGYRLLRTEGIFSEDECFNFSIKAGDPITFLNEKPEMVARIMGFSMRKINAAREFLLGRIARFRRLEM